MQRIAGWWDGFELWVAGLPFLPQFLVVLIGMVPVSLGIAYLLDRSLRAVLRLLGRDRVVAREEAAAVAGPPLPADFPVREDARREPAQSGVR
ncbi:hypothetical protein [Nocardia puris]|uniref:Uncharacterized protein n=1 Tax=Nocardia puris TaxID=208602 RepID=A0A366DEE5_9NOCA|nr:hypothetical protein [Nocardia puris]RBO88376.1 hypothetical protein DFR74_109144 [Nocardia puris]